MSEEKTVVITMTKGEFIHPAWREEGTVHEVDQRIADRWIAHGSARLGGDLKNARSKPKASEPELGDFASFPASKKFAEAGYTSIEAVKALVADKGDEWPKSVKGITKGETGKVSEALEALAKPVESTEGESTPEA